MLEQHPRGLGQLAQRLDGRLQRMLFACGQREFLTRRGDGRGFVDQFLALQLLRRSQTIVQSLCRHERRLGGHASQGHDASHARAQRTFAHDRELLRIGA